MSLALVTVTHSDFDFIQSHLLTYNPRYTNMHLREACQRNGRRDLRYLHAMHLDPRTSSRIDGLISGPDVFWRYQIIKTRTRTQLNVLAERAPAMARSRISGRFLIEIMKRIEQERIGLTHPPRRAAGQYYLQRRKGGVAATHPTCERAVATGVLASEFVERLAAWDLLLYRH